MGAGQGSRENFLLMVSFILRGRIMLGVLSHRDWIMLGVLSASAEEIVALFNRFIDGGICKSVHTDSRCGLSARSFYKEIINNNNMVAPPVTH
jgi:hypothetical protein